MQQQQQIQSAISGLRDDSSPKARKFKHLQVVVRALDKYCSDDQLVTSQRFIPCCLFVVPPRLCELIDHDPATLLEQKPQKMSYNLLINLYLKSMVRLLQQSAQEIRHVIVEGMSRAIVLVAAYPPLVKKWVKVLLGLWGTSSENLQISLRCHVAISKYLSRCDSNMYMWGMRRMYVSFFENCKQVSWRNFEHINFMINSFCEIVKFDTERAYYVLFGYLRSISLELDKLHKSKRKEKVELINKLFSNQILNCFKLFSAIVSRVESEDFTALIYPLCEMFAAYERITESPQYIPLKLHLLEYELTMVEALGIYVPHTLELLEKLIKYPTFNRKISKKSEKSEANIELAFKVSKTELSEALLINELFRSLMTKVFWFESLMCKTAYGSEVIMKLHKILRGHKYVFSEYQQQIQKATSLIKGDATTLYQTRAAEKMSVTANKKIVRLEQRLKQIAFSGPEKYQTLKAEEEQLLRNKLAAEQEEAQNPDSDAEPDSVAEDQDEVNSGWESADEGASELDPKQIQPSEDEESEDQGEMEEVSYEGDPEDADEAAKQWSEAEWSSQQADFE